MDCLRETGNTRLREKKRKKKKKHTTKTIGHHKETQMAT